MSVPEVRPPAGIRRPIDVTLRVGWTYDPKVRAFTSTSGERFALGGRLPTGTKVVHKTPTLVRADPSTLNAAELDLRRYVQIILPKGQAPEAVLPHVRDWEPVQSAALGPDVSLPGA